ncbi:MAG: M13 family metallopeptidase [Myxococcaceae bacterium]
MRIALGTALFSSLVFAAAPAAQPAATAPSEAPLVAGIDVKGIDKATPPGDDFNVYCNGTWAKTTEIPSDKPSYGVGWMVVDEAQKRTVALIQEAADSKAADGSDAKKIGDFYASYMDEAGIEAKGLTPLKPQLEQIAAITDKNMLATVLGGTVRADTDALNATEFHTPHLFGIWVVQTLFDPATNVPYLMQGGVLMPDRDYYVSKSPKMEEIRKAYQGHLAAMFKLAGYSDPAGRAGRVFALETKIANAHATRTESEDVKAAVVWKAAELPKIAPGLAWDPFLKAAKLSGSDTFIAWHPKAITGISALVASEPLDAWKDWLLVHTLDEWATFLPKAYVDERFAFYGKALSGTPEQRPRWKRGVDITSDAYGEAIGKLYVAKYFPPEAKAKVQALVEDLRAAFGKRIDALKWMTPATKAKAKEKLSTLKVGVGYPDTWRDYSGLKAVRGDALGNAQRASQFEYEHQLAKLGKPVDRGEWWMTPQTVNAVNLPLQNALNFPAAILQPPFFDLNADAATNYGSIGAVIGHEVSHSFDDSGSQFDAQGKMVNWWTKEDLEHFHESSEALAKQYDGYKAFPDLSLNGHQTLGENIADVAGLAAAYDAFQLSLKGKPAKVVQGFSGDQQFFIAYGQSWREKMRDEALRAEIATDGHSPAMWRVQTVRNLDAWYPAFKVKAGQKLFLAPKDRVRVW